MRKFMLVVMLGLFGGCATKTYNHEPIKNEILAYTKKAEIIINNNERVLIIATYINPISKEKNTENENFIISISPESAEISSINLNKDLNSTLSIINENDRILQELGFTLPWAKHYKISAASIKDEKVLNLDIAVKICETCSTHNAQISIQKISKSLYWNP
ncbi:hypothetical protein LMG7974_00186 [Campylobacter majalis]|uniref:Lipoprotein n=1 Tax=Campylobacter majalis TaxID=2790656 RepID=A0ABM8Q2A2_9BACT|nr:hypothetical protein [Campylobacter majalis]CAD7286989.1 hypothetical protein LMG7974_00186 [Campylobacter majalis]